MTRLYGLTTVEKRASDAEGRRLGCTCSQALFVLVVPVFNHTEHFRFEGMFIKLQRMAPKELTVEVIFTEGGERLRQ